jgi:hypothetical protein
MNPAKGLVWGHRALLNAFSIFPTASAILLFLDYGLSLVYLIITIIIFATYLAVCNFGTQLLMKKQGQVTYGGTWQAVFIYKYILVVAFSQYIVFAIYIVILLGHLSNPDALYLLIYGVVGFVYTLIFAALVSDVPILKTTKNMAFEIRDSMLKK